MGIILRLGACGLLSILLLGQDSDVAFQAGTRLVLVPFNVERGKYYAEDLQASDFILREDGHPRDFSIFEGPHGASCSAGTRSSVRYLRPAKEFEWYTCLFPVERGGDVRIFERLECGDHAEHSPYERNGRPAWRVSLRGKSVGTALRGHKCREGSHRCAVSHSGSDSGWYCRLNAISWSKDAMEHRRESRVAAGGNVGDAARCCRIRGEGSPYSGLVFQWMGRRRYVAHGLAGGAGGSGRYND